MPAPEITWTSLRSSEGRNVKWRFRSIKQDKFRRRYVCWLDRNNGDPTGQVERVFRAPVDVPDEYLSYPEDRPWRVEINFEGYARYLKRELGHWETKLQQIMLALPGGRGSNKDGSPSDEAIKMAGPKPQDWRLVVLAAKGDPWALGLTKKRTKAVTMIIGKESEEECRQREAAKRGAIASDLSLGAELDEAANENSIGSGGFADEEDDDLPSSVKKILKRQAKLEREAALETEVDGRKDDPDEDVLEGLEDDDLEFDDDDDDINLELDPDLENALDEEEEHDKESLGGGKRIPVKGEKGARAAKAAGGKKGVARAKSRGD